MCVCWADRGCCYLQLREGLFIKQHGHLFEQLAKLNELISHAVKSKLPKRKVYQALNICETVWFRFFIERD